MKLYFYDDFVVGNTIPGQAGKPDANIFDLADYGSFLFIRLKEPTFFEMSQFQRPAKRIRITCLPNTLWMTFKFGELEWGEAPYSPHLSMQAHLPQTIQAACSSLTIAVVDSLDGRLVYCERLKYDEAFSAALKTGVMQLLLQDFNREEYFLFLDAVKTRYSTREIAEKAIAECVFS